MLQVTKAKEYEKDITIDLHGFRRTVFLCALKRERACLEVVTKMALGYKQDTNCNNVSQPLQWLKHERLREGCEDGTRYNFSFFSARLSAHQNAAM